MKKRILFFAALMSLVAISTFGAGGVGVGNGRVSYRAPQGFEIAYPEALTLAVESDSAFRITNEKMVHAAEKISIIRFSVTRGRAGDLASVSALAHLEHPEMKFIPTELPGARGVYAETKSDDSITGVYYLLTTNLDLVEVDLDAYAAGNGLKWVAPIVDSFVYDATGPAIEEVIVPNRVWPAGSYQRIRMRAVDDYSGLSTTGFLFFSLREVGSDGEFLQPARTIYKELPFRVEGNWVTVEFPVGEFAKPGQYVISSLETRDKALNSGEAYVNSARDSFYEQHDHPELKVPVVHVTITNQGPFDLEAPSVLELRADTSVWEAGTVHRIFFRGADDVSGIDAAKFRCDGMRSIELKPTGYHSYAGDCGAARSEGDSWYSVEIKVNPYAPSGDYALTDLTIVDRAGNERGYRTELPPYGKLEDFYKSDGNLTALPVLHVRVHNGGNADVTPPTLLEVKVDSTIWRVGTTQRLRFRAVDAQSGIQLGYHGMGGYFIPVSDEKGSPTLYLDHDTVADGDDWYHIDIPISPYARGGEYFLYTFYVGDRSGNSNTVDCAFERVPFEFCHDSEGRHFAQIRVTVVR